MGSACSRPKCGCCRSSKKDVIEPVRPPGPYSPYASIPWECDRRPQPSSRKLQALQNMEEAGSVVTTAAVMETSSTVNTLDVELANFEDFPKMGVSEGVLAIADKAPAASEEGREAGGSSQGGLKEEKKGKKKKSLVATTLRRTKSKKRKPAEGEEAKDASPPSAKSGSSSAITETPVFPASVPPGFPPPVPDFPSSTTEDKSASPSNEDTQGSRAKRDSFSRAPTAAEDEGTFPN